jgi:tight adherence protein C
MLLLALGCLLAGFGLVLLLEEVFRGASHRRTSLRRVATYVVAQQEPQQAPIERRPHLGETLLPALSRVTLRLNPRVQLNDLQIRLAAAGLSSRLDAQQFLALKTVLTAVAVVVGFAAGGLGARGVLLALLLAAGARFVPDFLLGRLAKDRAERLSAHLPQAIDQIVVSLEAGLTFDAAVSYFVRRAKSPLADELRVMLTEIQMGESRADALRRLGERVPSEAMRTFVRTLVQSEGVGMSRTQILKGQASDLRNRWQLAAEERAQKAPVKMLFPTVIFILPVMFIVILGPAVHQIITLFGKP